MPRHRFLSLDKHPRYSTTLLRVKGSEPRSAEGFCRLARMVLASFSRGLKVLFALVALTLCLTTTGCGTRYSDSEERGDSTRTESSDALPYSLTDPISPSDRVIGTNVPPRDARTSLASYKSPTSAAAWLDTMIQAYRRTAKYSDEGFVMLSYRRLGESHSDRAPLSVAFVRDSALRLDAYAVQLVIRDAQLRSVIKDPLSENFDGQVLQQKLQSQSFALSDIYADPELAHFATAGLGGPSPQLELLLSEKPLVGLFEGDVKLALGQVEKIENADCQCVIVDSDSLRYQLWIDKQVGLLRRIELPSVAAGLEGDPAVKDVRLTIELANAKFEQSASRAFAVDPELLNSPNTKFVKSFVPLPPELISDLIGRYADEFALSDPTGRLLAGNRGSDRKTTVLLWIADHPASRMAASQLQIVADARETAGKKDSRIIVVMAEAPSQDTLVSPGQNEQTGALLRSWKVGLPYANDLHAVGRDVFQIAEAPTLVVIGPTGAIDWYLPRVGPEIAIQLPQLLDDLAAGKEVGKEIRRQYEADQATYQKLLQEAAVN